jgi:hypothetical protein
VRSLACRVPAHDTQEEEEVTGRKSGLAKAEAQRRSRFEKQLSLMPVEYLRCHNFGHKVEPATINPDGQFFVIGLVCGSCDMEIERWRDPVTGIARSRYWHPRGDYYFRGTGPITPVMKLEIEEQWRAAWGKDEED